MNDVANGIKFDFGDIKALKAQYFNFEVFFLNIRDIAKFQL